MHVQRYAPSEEGKEAAYERQVFWATVIGSCLLCRSVETLGRHTGAHWLQQLSTPRTVSWVKLIYPTSL